MRSPSCSRPFILETFGAVLLICVCLVVAFSRPALAADLVQDPDPTPPIPENTPAALAVLKVTVADRAAAERLFQGPWDLLEARDGNSYYVLGDEAVAQALRQEGFTVAVHEVMPAFAVSSYFGGFTTVAEGYAAMYQFAADHPDLVKLAVYGNSWRRVQDPAAGHELIALCITKMRPNDCALNPDTDKPRMLLMAGIHAREIATPELAIRWADTLVSTYGFDPEVTALMDYNEFWVIPYANPDGSDIVAAGGNSLPPLHRKNANDSQGICSDIPVRESYRSYHFGVDLNRNFDYQWGNTNVASSISSIPCLETYIGVGPASEPETGYLSTLLGQLFRDQRGPNATDKAPNTTTGLLLSLHSFKNAVLFPWGTKEQNAPNDPELRALAFRMSYFNRYATGRPPDIVHYTTSGAADDYSYSAFGIPSFTFEVGPESGDCSDFLVQFRCVETFWNQNYPALLYAAKSARQGYATGLGPTPQQVSIVIGALAGSQITAEISTYVSDRAYGSAPEGVAKPQPRTVVAAEYYIDTPPWEGGKPCRMDLAPVDPWPGDTKYATARLDVSGLPMGRHRVFVRARNEGGNWGPVSVQWLNIDGSIQLSGTCAPVSILDVAPLAVEFDRSNAGSVIPLVLTNSSIHYITSWRAAVSEPWVKLVGVGGITPSVLTVSIDRSQLSGGSHSATIVIDNLFDPTQQVRIPVTVNLPADKLVADQVELPINVVQGQGSAVVKIGNDNEGFPIAWSAQADQSWIILDRTSGVTPAELNVTVGPTASTLPPGIHAGSITLARTGPAASAADGADSDTLVIPVTLTIPPDDLRVDTDSVRLTTYDGRSSAVLNVANANLLKPIPWAAVSSSDYLIVSPTSGTTPAPLQLKFAADRLLPEGTYTTVITLTSPAVAGKQTVVPVTTVVDNHEMYLPVTALNAGADLIVSQIQATPAGIAVTISNAGAGAVVEPFWVDLYVEPDPAPAGVNDIWADGRSTYGAVWAVRAELLPGQSVTLTPGDTMFDAALSRLPPVLKAGSTIVVQVDSANTRSDYGGVRESHEYEPIGYYNNFASLRLLQATAGAGSGVTASAAPAMRSTLQQGATLPMPVRPQ